MRRRAKGRRGGGEKPVSATPSSAASLRVSSSPPSVSVPGVLFGAAGSEGALDFAAPLRRPVVEEEEEKGEEEEGVTAGDGDTAAAVPASPLSLVLSVVRDTLSPAERRAVLREAEALASSGEGGEGGQGDVSLWSALTGGALAVPSEWTADAAEEVRSALRELERDGEGGGEGGSKGGDGKEGDTKEEGGGGGGEKEEGEADKGEEEAEKGEGENEKKKKKEEEGEEGGDEDANPPRLSLPLSTDFVAALSCPVLPPSQGRYR